MEEYNPFDRLVSGISGDEREELLSKVQGAAGGSDKSPAPAASAKDSGHADVAKRYKAEPFYVRFWLWLKSLLTSVPVQSLYNDFLIAGVARRIERDFPDLIDSRKELLLSGLYLKTTQLRNCANFFRKYIAACSEDPDTFFVFMSSIIVPDLENRIKSETDPYNMPLDKEITPDLRISLLRRMDDILQGMTMAERGAMYAAVRCFEWMRQFVRLPFDPFVTAFSSVGDVYTCPFSAIADKPYIALFGKVMSALQQVPQGLLRALCAYAARGASADGSAPQEADADFLAKANAHVSTLVMFGKNVPLRLIGVVLYKDSSFQLEPMDGAEDWFVKFKAQWRKNFDRKWRSWTSDVRKEKIKERTRQYFSMGELPLLPNRPWQDLWGGTPFRYELTMGFLHSFMQNQYAQACMPHLKHIMLDGRFVRKDNASEFTDVLNDFDSLMQGIGETNALLAPSGEYGALFGQLSAAQKYTLQEQRQVEKIIGSLEGASDRFITSFCDDCRKMALMLEVIMGTKKDQEHEGLVNLASLGGRDNVGFRKKIDSTISCLLHAVEIVSELEPLDAPAGAGA